MYIEIFRFIKYMWGYISTEASYQFNFNTGFSTTRSDVLVHLSQWQYWWWFWFTLVWTFYYLITSRVIRFRVLKMRPKIATSYRPHGKWGDFLACIIPAIWCINILANSNFILRLIEWQNESSLFTVRVRARQWYWIYKFELKNFTDILSAPKNLGKNKWLVSTFGDLQTADDYLHILQLRSQNKWVKKYWSDILKKSGKINKTHIVAPQEQLRINISENFKNYPYINVFNITSLNNSTLNLNNNTIYSFLSNNSLDLYNNKIQNKNSIYSNIKNFNEWSSFLGLEVDNSLFFFNNLFSNKFKKSSILKEEIYSNNLVPNLTNLSITRNNRNFADYVDTSRWVRRSNGLKKPLRIIKLPLLIDDKIYQDNISSDTFDLLRIRYNLENTKIQHKDYSNNPYLTLKQKKYKKKTTIAPIIKYYRDENGVKLKKIRYSAKPVLINNSIFEDNIYDPKIQYKLLMKNKVRDDLIPVTLARRILRTKKTLVLPAHVNITLITNSYDIVHSWFIPGLGIKLDCVPGRSTHHTFYIDNVGFYYGQCAEICGRYHHHMPIRVCALPFEHFLTWWHTFGLPKLLFTTTQKRYESYYAFRKFVW